MKLITKKTDYALRALSFMAQKNSIVSVNKMATDLMIPKPFLRSILQELEKTKIVKSIKGKGGGFDLAKASEKIFLTELIAIFQGPIKLHECLIRKSTCPDVKECLLKEKIEKIRKYVVAELESITINSIIKKEEKDGKDS